MKKIAVIAAMDKEVELLKQLNNKNIAVIKCGIGKVSAALKTAEVIKSFQPDLIINSGIAGGLSPNLNIGDIVAGTKIAYHDVWCGNPNLIGQVQGFPLYFQSDTTVLETVKDFAKCGLIISGDQFISDVAEFKNLLKKFPDALAVDMESAAIAQTCYIYNVPFISLRLISDTPGVEHHQKQYEAFWATAGDVSFKAIRCLIEKI